MIMSNIFQRCNYHLTAFMPSFTGHVLQCQTQGHTNILRPYPNTISLIFFHTINFFTISFFCGIQTYARYRNPFCNSSIRFKMCSRTFFTLSSSGPRKMFLAFPEFQQWNYSLTLTLYLFLYVLSVLFLSLSGAMTTSL